jgi:hypothetical protein
MAEYYQREWKLFFEQPIRAEASREATANLQIRRVLDIGCGAGQELTPCARLAFSASVSILSLKPLTSHARTSGLTPRCGPVFCKPAANCYLTSDAFEMVICRVSLQYMKSASPGRSGSVLKPGGVNSSRLFLYPADTLAVQKRNWRSFVHGARVLTTGVLYHRTNKQSRRWPLVPETRMPVPCLKISAELPDSTPQTPSLVLTKL